MRTHSFYEMNKSTNNIWSENDLAKTQEIYPNYEPEECCSNYEKNYAEDLQSEMEMQIIDSFLEDKVGKLVEIYLAENAQAVIDLAIKTYILQRKNEKVETRSYALTKKSVSKNNK